MRRRLPFPALLLSLACLVPPGAHAANPANPAGIDPALLAGLKARSIGPANMSGRVAAIAGAESDPGLLYVGAASGGVWKSANGGLTWEPVFDDQPVASIGSVSVFQPNPDVVWVGTGEGNVRNSVSIGRGVYRSLDGGRTWKSLGLEATERIPRIALHPSDSNVAYVAALGRLWGENPERGVFKTVDGGRTWKKVLYVDERTGAAEIVMDPSNPNKLFAAMWDYRRWPWSFRSGGPGSGLYVTYDGGESWKRLTEDDGLPKGDLGRIGISISRSNPSIVYALVEAEKSALLRSDDGGRRWRSVNDDQRTASRPFYYADIHVDPAWPNRIYNLAARITVSNDSGATFGRLGRSNEIHADYHALWIDPRDPEHLVVGNDGGLGISHDRGETWRFVANLPIAQYYHVAVDMDTPYNIYGGLQDNGSWRGPSSVWEDGGPRNQHWDRVGFGDGFDTLPDPRDSTTGYSMAQGGSLLRWNLKSGEVKSIRPPEVSPADPAERLRFNWNTGIALDPFEPDTVYYGSQYVHKSTDRGETWSVISPDLTTDNAEWQKQGESGGLTIDASGAENFTTILAIAPSPLTRGVIWVGTDDGRLHVTRDGGASWESVEKNLRGVPANTWIPHIRPSKFDAASAFVVLDNHRRSDFTPYVYRTDDYGKTWKSLAAPNLDGYALAIEQDPVDRDLLFLGTELGLWVSLDAGGSWQRFKHGVPTTSVMDLAIHPRDHDLIVGTHGRALFVLDDITPLREISAGTLAEPLHVFPSSPGILYDQKMAGGVARGGGAGEFQGENRPYGAMITYSLNLPGLPHPDPAKERERKEKERAEARKPAASSPTAAPAASIPLREDPPQAEAAEPAGARGRRRDGQAQGPRVEIRITDAAGKLIRKMDGPANLGVNRATWDMRRDAFRRPPREDFGGGGGGDFGNDGGPAVPPGTYDVTVKYKDQEAKGTARVVADPFTRNSEADWQTREAAVARLQALNDALIEAIERVRAARDDIDSVTRRAAQDKGQGPENPFKALEDSGRQLKRKLTDLEKRLFVPPGTKGLTDDQTALSRVGYALMSLMSSWSPPNATQQAYIDRAETDVQKALADFNRLFAEDVSAFRLQVEAAKVNLLPKTDPVVVGGKP